MIYAAAGVKEYRIVRPEEKRIEVYRLPRADGHADRTIDHVPEIFASAALPGVSVDPGAFFA